METDRLLTSNSVSLCGLLHHSWCKLPRWTLLRLTPPPLHAADSIPVQTLLPMPGNRRLSPGVKPTRHAPPLPAADPLHVHHFVADQRVLAPLQVLHPDSGAQARLKPTIGAFPHLP